MGGEEDGELSVGVPFGGVINAESTVISVGVPKGYFNIAPPVHTLLRFTPPADGDWTISLHSDYFDSYLLVFNEAGHLLSQKHLAEGYSRDDDGWYGLHSRLALKGLIAGQNYQVVAVALHGQRGTFTASVVAGIEKVWTYQKAERENLKDLSGALDRIAKQTGKSSMAYGRAQYFLGLALLNSGQIPESGSLLAGSLQTLEDILGEGEFLTTRTRSLLANVQLLLGKNTEARRLWEKNLALEGNDPITLLQLGKLYLSQGNLLDAELFFNRAIGEIKPETGLEIRLAARFQAGRLYKERFRWNQALKSWNTALSLSKDSIDFSLSDSLELQLGMGEACQYLEDYERAFEHFESSKKLAERIYGIDHPRTARVLNFLGVAEGWRGNLTQATEVLNQSLSIYQEAGLSFTQQEIIDVNRDLASVEWQAGMIPEALNHADASVKGAEERMWSQLAGLSEFERLVLAKSQTNKISLLLSITSQRDKDLLRQYQALLRWKGQVSRSLSASQRRLNPESQAVYDEMKALDGLLWEAIFGQGSAHEAKQISTKYNALQREFLQLTGTGKPQSATFQEVANALTPGTVAIDFYAYPPHKKTRTESSLWGEDELVAWVFKSEASVPIRVDLGPVAPLQEEVEKYLDYLVPNRGGRALRSKKDRPGSKLTRLLWEPLAKQIGQAETVFVSPDSFLATLPLETLPIGEEEFLVEKHAFVYSQDLVSLVTQRDAMANREGSLLAVGGVVYDERAEEVSSGKRIPPEIQEDIDYLKRKLDRGRVSQEEYDEEVAFLMSEIDTTRGSRGDETTFTRKWDFLENTLPEAKAVISLFKDQHWKADHVLLSGTQASEGRLKQEIPHYRYLHLATHGYFEPEELPNLAAQIEESDLENQEAADQLRTQRRLAGRMPGLLSGLVFAGVRSGETGNQDGYLTAEEVSSLDLRACDLVVLSACNTATGAQRAGEGMMGLRRSFRQAGARTVISSLWPVSDEATAELMKAFYLRLWEKGKNKSEALVTAQRNMLKKLRENGEASPRLWGAFVLSGDWR